MPRGRVLSSLAFAAVAVGSLAAITGCVPSDARPSLGVAPVDTVSHEPTGNPDVDRLLDRLDAVGDKTFTAAYSIKRKLGDLQRAANVVQSPPHNVVRIGDVALFSDPPQQTCDNVTSICETGLLEQRISDVGISSRFYGPATAQQLRVAVARESADPTVDTMQIAGVEADCLHVSVGGGQETYCVTADGLVALLDTAAVHIELTSLSEVADSSAFARPGQASTATSS
jgi:hypothetical protein